MKAKFIEQQKPVLIKQLSSRVYVYICLNGTRKSEKFGENEKPVDCWEYDYHEFSEKEGVLDLADVKANPEKYLNYEPEKEKSDSEKIAELQSQNDMLTQCILEMSTIVYK